MYQQIKWGGARGSVILRQRLNFGKPIGLEFELFRSEKGYIKIGLLRIDYMIRISVKLQKGNKS